ncbi:MAG: tyrosine-type recombinase/integrase [Acidimicrobiales bacterium]
MQHVVDYHAHLLELGYSLSAAKKHRQLVTHLSGWLEREGIVLQELTAPATEGFFRARRRHGTPNLRTTRSIDPLLDYLRSLGVIVEPAPVAPSDPVSAFCEHYRRYLLVERGLAKGSAHFYVYVAALLAGEHRHGEKVDWLDLRAGHVTDFVTRTCAGRGLSSARQVVSALRSVLRFLAAEGQIELALDQAVLSVAGRNSSLPRGIRPDQVEALVAACAGESAILRRDRAIVLLLCRLGLRGGEVISLRLDDIDWRGGEVVIEGKGGRRDRLPLPADVGAALSDYLKIRPPVPDRRVFLRLCAPISGITETGTIRSVLERACQRAQIGYVNPHRLRHSLATTMLSNGVSLRDIGQVLGHRDVAATATYAKVDLASLETLARRWPEVRS